MHIPNTSSSFIETVTDGTEFLDIFGRALWPGRNRVLRTPFFETWKHKLGAEENETNQPVITQPVIFGKVNILTHSFHST